MYIKINLDKTIKKNFKIPSAFHGKEKMTENWLITFYGFYILHLFC